jgi:hypothetical protein
MLLVLLVLTVGWMCPGKVVYEALATAPEVVAAERAQAQPRSAATNWRHSSKSGTRFRSGTKSLR